MTKQVKTAQPAKNDDRKPAAKAPVPASPGTETPSAQPAQPGAKEKNGQEAKLPPGVLAKAAGKLVINGEEANQTVRQLIDKMLIEGSTLEDLVATAGECGIPGVTLSAVRTYFQGRPDLQAERAHYMVETSETLLKRLGDPDSAEARLARAVMMTGFSNLNQVVAQVSPKDAEHSRIERANLNLKHKLVVAQRDKARQALRFDEERIRLLVVQQQKFKQEMEMLQQEAKRQQAGEPLGPAMLQRIQQIYGLTCQPMPYGGSGDGAKA